MCISWGLETLLTSKEEDSIFTLSRDGNLICTICTLSIVCVSYMPTDDTNINNSITDTFQRTTKSGGLRWVRTRLEVHGRVAHEFSSPLSVMFARPLRLMILVFLYRIKITTFASYTFHI